MTPGGDDELPTASDTPELALTSAWNCDAISGSAASRPLSSTVASRFFAAPLSAPPATELMTSMTCSGSTFGSSANCCSCGLAATSASACTCCTSVARSVPAALNRASA